MLDSDSSRSVKLALEALPLIAKGASERGAILRAVQQQPSLAEAKREALSLVLETLDEQDLLDRLIRDSLPDKRVAAKALALYRLATHLMVQAHDRESIRQIEKTMRILAPSERLPELELLLGTLVAIDPSRQWPSLTDSERVGMNTH